MAIREYFEQISPPWLVNTVGGRLLYSIAIQCDAFWVLCEQGVKARFPGQGVDTALPASGADRVLPRYLYESDALYAARQLAAHNSWRRCGSPHELINQTQRACFAISAVATPVRTVSDSHVWHSRATITSDVEQSSALVNWQWDPLTGTRWWRGWLIIDSTLGPWQPEGLWGSPGAWGDGGVWGSTATPAEVTQAYAIIRQWKPAHVAVRPIVVYSSTILRPTDTSPTNPNGDGYTFAWQASMFAAFGEEII